MILGALNRAPSLKMKGGVFITVASPVKIPGPSGKELSHLMVYLDKGFNPLHIRPSGVGLCLKAQVLTILHARYPQEKSFLPDNPAGKDGLALAAAFGNAYEEWRYDQAWAPWEGTPGIGKVFGGVKQYDLSHPTLKNIDGTPITSHPDIAVENEDGIIVLDEEIKTTGECSREYLPKEPHLEQRLLRQWFWKHGVGVEPAGRIHYGFRGSFTNPEAPADFELIPHEKGMLGLWNETVYEWEFINSLEERLRYILECVQKKSIPPRHPKAEDQHYYECYFQTKEFQAECPWRESCWAEELAYERRPPILVINAEETILTLRDLKEKKAGSDKESRALHYEIKKLQKRLDPFFEEFGDRISAGGVTVDRTLVKVPEKKSGGYEFFRYDIK